jgi:D-amino-acid dehydrogenase
MTGSVLATPRAAGAQPIARATVLRLARDLFPDAADYDRGQYRACLRPMTPDGPPILGLGTATSSSTAATATSADRWLAAPCASSPISLGGMPELDLQGLSVRR